MGYVIVSCLDEETDKLVGYELRRYPGYGYIFKEAKDKRALFLSACLSRLDLQ